MPFRLSAVTALAALAIGAVYLLLRDFRQSPTDAERLPADDPLGATVEHADRAAETSFDPLSRQAPPETDALAAMSETFRHTSLLIAIREAGFVCDAVTAAHQTGERLWMVSCGDMRGYEVSVTAQGELSTQPALHYFDGLQPRFRPERGRPLDREPF